jgi:exopolysaccharide biosynthesis polyprenyl glycosylphosphotransferase
MPGTIAPPRPITPRPPTVERGYDQRGSRGSRARDPRPALRFAVDAAAAFGAVAITGGEATAGLAFLLAVSALNIGDRLAPSHLIPTAAADVPALALRGLLLTLLIDVAGASVYAGSLLGLPHRAMPLVTASLYVALGLFGRVACYSVLRRLRQRRRLVGPALIVGTGRVGVEIATVLRERPEYGLEPLGFVDAAPPLRPELLPEPLVGGLGELPRLIVEHGVRHVFVTFCQLRDADLVELLRACDRSDCEVLVVPRLFELGATGSAYVDHIWGIPLVALRRPAFRSRLWTVKRTFDIAFAAAALILLSPLLLAIGAVLRREVGPSVLFRQTRLGLEGQPFPLVKFRTIKPSDAAERTQWSVVPADRVGPIGRFLRRSSLDELPQLWNVLCGHMSIVGPRPEQPGYVAQFSRRHRGYAARLRVPAGVTGWAQIHDLRGRTSVQDRARFDNFYIEQWSLWRDVRILLATVAAVFGLRGS